MRRSRWAVGGAWSREREQRLAASCLCDVLIERSAGAAVVDLSAPMAGDTEREALLAGQFLFAGAACTGHRHVGTPRRRRAPCSATHDARQRDGNEREAVVPRGTTRRPCPTSHPPARSHENVLSCHPHAALLPQIRPRAGPPTKAADRATSTFHVERPRSHRLQRRYGRPAPEDRAHTRPAPQDEARGRPAPECRARTRPAPQARAHTRPAPEKPTAQPTSAGVPSARPTSAGEAHRTADPPRSRLPRCRAHGRRRAGLDGVSTSPARGSSHDRFARRSASRASTSTRVSPIGARRCLFRGRRASAAAAVPPTRSRPRWSRTAGHIAGTLSARCRLSRLSSPMTAAAGSRSPRSLEPPQTRRSRRGVPLAEVDVGPDMPVVGAPPPPHDESETCVSRPASPRALALGAQLRAHDRDARV